MAHSRLATLAGHTNLTSTLPHARRLRAIGHGLEGSLDLVTITIVAFLLLGSYILHMPLRSGAAGGDFPWSPSGKHGILARVDSFWRHTYDPHKAALKTKNKVFPLPEDSKLTFHS